MDDFNVKISWHYVMEVKHITCIHFLISVGIYPFHCRFYNYTPLMSTPVGEVAAEEEEAINILNNFVLPYYGIKILN